MKKSMILCLVTTLIVTGCRKKEVEAVDYHATLSDDFYEAYSWISSDIKINYNFFFDVDGDGIEEAFYVRYETDDRYGHLWRVFYFEDGKWQNFGYNDILAMALPWDFYYRDDTKQQPLLFVNDRESGPQAYTRNKKVSKHIVVTPFDRQEFEHLQKQGILKRVTWYWYDKDGTRHVGEPPEDEDSPDDEPSDNEE